jgi:hypothetical protein
LEALRPEKDTGARGTTGGIKMTSKLQYIDTGALIALSDLKDKNHDKSVNYVKESVRRGMRFVIGKNVLVEYIDGVTKRIGKEKAVYELDKILNSKIVFLEFDTRKDWNKALEYFQRYNNKEIDLTDCLSFAIIERLNIEEVFTFDSDFKTHGFVVVP